MGFSYGQNFERTLPDEGPVSFSTQHPLWSNVDVFTVGAAFDVTYGNFRKRIVNQLTRSRINDLVNATGEHLNAAPAIRLFPNPAKTHFTIIAEGATPGSLLSYTIYDIAGAILQESNRSEWNRPVDISALPSGAYIIRVSAPGWGRPVIRKMIKG